MQFKSFSVVFMQRVMGREIYGRGADSLGRGLIQNFVPQTGERGLMPEVFAMTTLFGLGAMTVKAFAAGRTPREFDDPKTWLAAMIQGGGLGIYGDYLFGEASRMGDSFLSSLAGPAMGSASSLVGLWQAFKDGQDVSATAFRTLWSHLPGNNLFYTKLALDQAICNGVYESLNPGYLRRMRRRVTRETNQEFLWEPQSWW